MPKRLRRLNPSLVALVAEGFFSRLSFGLIGFALPLYAHQLGMSLAQIGVLTSFNLIVAALLKPATGAAADRIGLRPSLSAAIALRSLTAVLLALAALPWQLFAVRSVHGVSIAVRDPAVDALIAEHGGKRAVASAFAWYQTAKSTAGSLGKAAAGVLLTLTASSFATVFLVAFALSALPLYVVLRHVREPKRTEPSTHWIPDDVPEPEPVGARTHPVSDSPGGEPPPAVLPFMGLGFFVSGTAYMLGNLFPLIATEYAGLSAAQAGSIYLLSIAAALSGPAFGWLADNVSRRLVLSMRSVANGVSSLLYLAFPSFAGVAAGRLLDDLGKAAFRPAWGSLMAYVSSFDRRRRARTMGFLRQGEDAGEIAGPVAAGLIWSAWGVPALLGVRIAVAIVTELYTILLTRSLGRPRGRELSRPSGPVLRPASER
jgi:MFS family permease